MSLYHFTCQHGHDALGQSGVLLPARVHTPAALNRLALIDDPWMRAGAVLLDLIWLTDLMTPDRLALGLTADTLAHGCDRTRYRYRATDTANVRPYLKAWRSLVSREMHLELTSHPDTLPGHWFIATDPVPVVLDQPRRLMGTQSA